MAIGFRSASSFATDVTSGSVSCTKPAGVVSGDVMFAIAARSQTAAATTSFSSTGWSVAGFFAGTVTDFAPIAVLYKVAGGSEPASYTFTSNGFSGSDQFVVHILALTGVDVTTPVAVAPAKTDAGSISTSVVAPSVTIPAGLPDQAWLVSAFTALWFGSASFGAATGMTERVDVGDVWLHVATDTQAVAAGATGTRTALFSQTPNNPARGLSFGVRPATINQAVSPVGIASTATIGSPTVTPGSVDVVATGIPPAEAFGAAAVDLQIDAAGIASAEAFGTVEVTNNTITLVGIASAEAFGAAVVHNYGLGPEGIGSAEAFGTPLVALVVTATSIGTAEAFGAVVLDLTLTFTGIPSAEAFGTTSVLAGPVSITPAGIGSAEAFGGTKLTLTVDTSSLRLRPRSHTTVTYELVCVARIPQIQGPPVFLEIDPIDWSGLSWTDELNRPQRLDASVSIATLTEPVVQRLQDLAQNASELWLYRDGRLVFAGPWQGWLVQGETLTLQASGLLGYLKYWAVSADLTFTQVDQHAIVKGLVDHWQAQEYGHFGIDTANVTASGVLRDATYLAKEEHNIGQRVEELGKRQNGFDVAVDPATRALQLWSPLQGVDRSTGEDAIVFDARNVTSTNVSCSVAPGMIASEAFGTGTGTGDTIYAAMSNPELRARFGRTSVSGTFDGVSEQATLDAHTQALIDARGGALLIPGPDVRTVPDADLAAYNVGDTVAYELHDRLGVRGAFRLRRRAVSVSKTGVERTANEFV